MRFLERFDRHLGVAFAVVEEGFHSNAVSLRLVSAMLGCPRRHCRTRSAGSSLSSLQDRSCGEAVVCDGLSVRDGHRLRLASAVVH